MAARKKSKAAKTVDEYIAAAPKEMQKPLRDLRKAIKTTAPKAEETIGWGMPYYRYHGMLVFFAAFKNHMSFFPASYTTIKEFRDELEPFEISGTTIHFTPENPLPAKLVERIVKARVKENDAKVRKKQESVKA